MFFNNLFGCNNCCDNCKHRCERCEQRKCCHCCEKRPEPLPVKPCCRCGGNNNHSCGCSHCNKPRRIECRCVCGDFNNMRGDD